MSERVIRQLKRVKCANTFPEPSPRTTDVKSSFQTFGSRLKHCCNSKKKNSYLTENFFLVFNSLSLEKFSDKSFCQPQVRRSPIELNSLRVFFNKNGRPILLTRLRTTFFSLCFFFFFKLFNLRFPLNFSKISFLRLIFLLSLF